MTEPIYQGWTPGPNWHHPREIANLCKCGATFYSFYIEKLCPNCKAEQQGKFSLDDMDVEYTKRINEPRG